MWEIDQLPQAELDDWREYYRLYPFDDHHRYHRPAALIASNVGGIMSSNYDMNAALRSNLEFLSPEPLVSTTSDADITTMRTLGIKPPPHFMKARTE